MFIRLIPVLATVLLTAAFSPASAQQQAADSKAEVPALRSFHEVIYVIWHEAYPSKDVVRLRQLVPDVEKKAAELRSAQLPGILHHREEAWREGVAGMESAVADYRKAAEGADDGALLSAAEKLHARFEKLAQSIRPPVKELEDFHSTLYMLYHHYLPDYQIDKIRQASAELKQKMPALAAASLPPALGDKKDAFEKGRQDLSIAVDRLAAVVKSGDEATVRQAVEELHSRYEAVASSIGAH